MRTRRAATFAALLTLLTAGGVEAVTDPGGPGSVLVFPKFVVGVDADGVPASSFEVSVVCPLGASCSPSTPVRIRGLWICPGTPATVDPALKQICQSRDFTLQTAANGTLWFNPDNAPAALSPSSGGNPGPLSPNLTPTVPTPECDRGALVLWVVDAFLNAISFNGLVGDAILAENGARSAYSALAIQAVPPSGSVLAGPDDQLAFNDQRYTAIAGRIAAPLRYESGNTVETRLTLFVLTTWASRSNHLATVPLAFFNENAVIMDARTAVLCWSEQRLTDIDPRLTTAFGGDGARKGLVRMPVTATLIDEGFGINPPATFPVPIVGLVETILRDPVTGATRSSAYSLYQDGPGVPACLRRQGNCFP